MNSKPEGCPFCGQVKFLDVEAAPSGHLYVTCDACCGRGPVEELRDTAVEMWNRAYIFTKEGMDEWQIKK